MERRPEQGRGARSAAPSSAAATARPSGAAASAAISAAASSRTNCGMRTRSATQPTPAELAGGIYTALVTTVWGLVAAIPALTFFFVFKMKVQRLSFELSAVAIEIVERFKPMSQGGK